MRIRTHTNPFIYHERMNKMEFTHPTNPDAPIDVEIGFGRGIFVRHYGKLNPNRILVGLEIRKMAVEILKERLDKEPLNLLPYPKNAHLIHGNGQIFLEDCVEDHSLSNIFVFHPDPWFKKRHHKRRVVNDKFLDVVSKKLVPDGKLYISTDAEPLWIAMEETFSNRSDFTQIEDASFWKTNYASHWDSFSQEDQRRIFYACYHIL